MSPQAEGKRRSLLQEACGMFEADPVGLRPALEKRLASAFPSGEWEEAESAFSLWRRGGRYVLRKCMGSRRWNQWQTEEDWRQGRKWIRRQLVVSAKPVLAFVVPFDIWKLRTGGGGRIAGIAKVLSADFNVFILSLVPSSRPFSVREISPGIRMTAIPASLKYEQKALELEAESGAAAPLFAFADHFDHLPQFKAVLETLADAVQVWAIPVPMAWGPIQRFGWRAGQALVYDPADDLLAYFQIGLHCRNLSALRRLEKMERDVVSSATVVSFCHETEAAAVRARYPEAAGRIVVVPNGVDVDKCRMIPPAQALETRQIAGLDRMVAVFAGAYHKPNCEAVDRIVRELAPAFPKVVFVVMGMHLAPYRESGGAAPGDNVVFTGPVSEEIKETIFSLADVALAPMKNGTGSSLKIPDYLAHGKVVVGTPMGWRTFEAFARFPSAVVSEDLRGALTQVLKEVENDPGKFTSACREARELAKATLDWSVTATPILDMLRRRRGNAQPEPSW